MIWSDDDKVGMKKMDELMIWVWRLISSREISGIFFTAGPTYHEIFSFLFSSSMRDKRELHTYTCHRYALYGPMYYDTYIT